jgi:hypothetical protein
MSALRPPTPPGNPSTFETELDDDDISDHPSSSSSTEPSSNPKGSVIAGAAAVGALTGAVLLGPLTAVVAGGAMAVATMTNGPVGEFARSAGSLGAAVGNKANEVNKKHDITGKTKTAASSAYTTAKSFDEKHNITGKTKNAALSASRSASEFDKKHNITGKAANAATGTINYVTEKIEGTKGDRK